MRSKEIMIPQTVPKSPMKGETLPGRGQEEHHLLESRDLGVRGLEQGPVEAVGLLAGPAVARPTTWLW